MKHFTKQKKMSNNGILSTDGAIRRWLSLLPLMVLMMWLVPTGLRAQVYDNSVTYTARDASWWSYSGQESDKLFDGKKTQDNFSKWYTKLSPTAYVIFEASKAGIPIGYTITTCDDTDKIETRNPLSWKLYGNNEGKKGPWTLIDEVINDTKIKAVNYTSYNYTCKTQTKYKYYKWEITAVHAGSYVQVAEFELKLVTCSHIDSKGQSTLGKTLNTVPATCVRHAYTTHECSQCKFVVEVEQEGTLAKHTLVHHNANAPTCIKTGNVEYWQCSVCNKIFGDKDATKELTTNVVEPIGHKYNEHFVCTVCGYEDARYKQISMNGVTITSFTDNDYPWVDLDLSAKNMNKFNLTDDFKGLMSSNYHIDNSSSETTIKFTSPKTFLLSFYYALSSETTDKFSVFVDGKQISKTYVEGVNNYKVVLSEGSHTLKLSYVKDRTNSSGADRAIIYNFMATTTLDGYVAVYDETSQTLTLRKSKTDEIAENNVYILNDAPKLARIIDVYKQIRNIVIDESCKTYKPTALNSFFANLESLVKITGLENINFGEAKDLSYLFSGCKNLSDVEINKLNIDKATDISGMFQNCMVLANIDLSNFNSANVKNMKGMFENCFNLKSIIFGDTFDTQNVTSMSGMFKESYLLETLDLSLFNTSKVIYMEEMFSGCTKLNRIYVSDLFTTDNVQFHSDMFKNCKRLPNIDLNVTNRTHANYGEGGYFTYAPVATVAYNSTTKVLSFAKRRLTSKLNENEVLVAMLMDPTKNTNWFNDNSTSVVWPDNVKEATSVVIDQSLNDYALPTCKDLFNGFTLLASISGLKNLNTANATSMECMFQNCTAMDFLDLSCFNTKSVESMAGMFKMTGDNKLKTIVVGEQFSTNALSSHNEMFYGCKNLPNFNAAEVDKTHANYGAGGYLTYYLQPSAVYNTKTNVLTFKIRDITHELGTDETLVADFYDPAVNANWFNGTKNKFYWSDDVKNAVTKVVIEKNFSNYALPSCKGMFEEFNKLYTIEGLNNLNTTNVKSMVDMFFSCDVLSSLDFTGFNTANVTDMTNMFRSCMSLTSLDLTSFNTAKVEQMYYMFQHCDRLKTLDLTSFNTAKVENMSYMFATCKEIEDIYVSDSFSTAKVTKSSDMFYNANYWLQNYNPKEVDKTHAHYGEGGYFKFKGVVAKLGDKNINGLGNPILTESVELTDDNDLEVYKTFTAKNLVYTYNVGSSDKWQSMYVPFDLDISKLPEEYEVATINNFHEYEQNDGSYNVVLEANYANTGTIPALNPFIIRLKQEAAEDTKLTLNLSNAKICANNNKIVDCSSVTRHYVFNGVFKSKNTFDTNTDFVMQEGTLLKATSDAMIKPQRWYLTATDRTEDTSASTAKLNRIAIRVIGDGKPTGIDEIHVVSDKAAQSKLGIYDLQGRKLSQEPTHGIYIKNGKKYVK